jgi:hypothetical protein
MPSATIDVGWDADGDAVHGPPHAPRRAGLHAGALEQPGQRNAEPARVAHELVTDLV